MWTCAWIFPTSLTIALMCMPRWMNIFFYFSLRVCACVCVFVSVWKSKKGGVVAVTRHKGGLGAVNSREEKREWPEGPGKGGGICRVDEWKHSKGQIKINQRPGDLKGHSTWFPSFSYFEKQSVTRGHCKPGWDDSHQDKNIPSQDNCDHFSKMCTTANQKCWIPSLNRVKD